MDKIRQMLAKLLILAVLLVGMVGICQEAPRAVAVAKSYELIYGRKTKIGSYYYKVTMQGKLQRSKTKNRNYKTVLDKDASIYKNKRKTHCL